MEALIDLLFVEENGRQLQPHARLLALHLPVRLEDIEKARRNFRKRKK